MADIVEASKPEEENEADKTEDDDDDAEFSDTAEVFLVEDILDYRADFEDGKVRYEVKWKGYEENETTWEPEESFVGAREVLERYWEKLGGKPKPDHRIPTAKKRGRPSAGRTSSLNGGPAKKQRRSGDHSETDASARKSSDDGDDLNSLGPDDYTDLLGSDEWTPPIVSSESWERLVQKVETVEADDDGNLWVFLSWNLKDKDGRFLRNKVKATTCYKACPQLMLRFFESHLVLPSNKVIYS